MTPFVLDTTKIRSVSEFALNIYETVQVQLDGGACRSAAVREALCRLSRDGVSAPDCAFVTLSLIALMEYAESDCGAIYLRDFTALIHRLAAHSGEASTQQALSTVCYIQCLYPNTLLT